MNLPEVVVVSILATVALTFLCRPKDDETPNATYWVAYAIWMIILGSITGALWFGLSWTIIGLHNFFNFLGGLIF